MDYAELGKTGLKASRLGFGSMRLPMVKIGGESFVDLDRAVEVIRHALRRGVNYIDSGFLYGNRESELAVGRALKGRRGKAILTTKATKQRMAEPGDLRRMLEHQLRKTDAGYFDFYCLHGISWETVHAFEEKTGWLGDLRRAKDEGLFRHAGFSFHGQPEDLPRLVDLGVFEMVTCQYNYLDRRNLAGMKYAKKKGLGVVVMGPVGGGRLAGLPGFVARDGRLGTAGAANLAVRFVLAEPAADVVLSGMGSREMVDENAAAVGQGPLDRTEKRALEKLLGETEKLAELYCTGCGYCQPCPRDVNIPGRFSAMINHKVYGLEQIARDSYRQVREAEAALPGRGECSECGQCEKQCPQNIEIIRQLKETVEALGA